MRAMKEKMPKEPKMSAPKMAPEKAMTGGPKMPAPAKFKSGSSAKKLGGFGGAKGGGMGGGGAPQF
jgi:hypothetical protein